MDALAYGIHAFQKRFKVTRFHHGFVLTENFVMNVCLSIGFYPWMTQG